MANEQNLIPFTTGSREEAREAGRKGGIASGKARRARRAMRDTLDLLLRTDVGSKEIRESMSEMGIDEEDQNYQMLFMMSVFKGAVKGDKEDLKFIVDMLNERPVNNQSDTNNDVGNFRGTIIVDDLEYEDDEDNSEVEEEQ